MPSMPDKMPYLPNGGPRENEHQATTTALDNKVDIKAAEKRILSSTEHLNEILALNALVAVKPSSR
jgi:hypothetical protein